MASASILSNLSALNEARLANRRTVSVGDQLYGLHNIYLPEELNDSRFNGLLIFAEDDCGNWVAEAQSTKNIVFIDHETDEQTTLAENIESFLAGLIEWDLADFDIGEVQSAWIDPEFLKEIEQSDT